MKVCVIIPAHNEEKHIAAVVSAVRTKGFDVVVIDDGSIDRTGALARECGAVTLRNEPRQGKGFSLKKGFAYIVDHGYEGAVTMDGDGQHDPDDLEKLIGAAKGKTMCIVNGTRMGEARKMPFVRRVTNRLMSSVISWICGRRIEDTQCGYRFVGSDVLRKIELTADEFEIETEVLIKSCRAGCEVYSVPIRTIYLDEKSKINPVKDTVRFISYLLREFKNQRP